MSFCLHTIFKNEYFQHRNQNQSVADRFKEQSFSWWKTNQSKNNSNRIKNWIVTMKLLSILMIFWNRNASAFNTVKYLSWISWNILKRSMLLWNKYQLCQSKWFWSIFRTENQKFTFFFICVWNMTFQIQKKTFEFLLIFIKYMFFWTKISFTRSKQKKLRQRSIYRTFSRKNIFKTICHEIWCKW